MSVSATAYGREENSCPEGAIGANWRRLIGAGSTCAVMLLAAWFAPPVLASARAAAPSGQAPDGPGATSYLDTARKDCFGTARNTTSKVWFTVADGVLSDVFSPTIEQSNVSTVQYIVTDGRTFADLQQRDMTYSVSSPNPSGMVCQVTSTDRAHGFRLVSDYITDPARDSVVIHTTLVPISGGVRSIRKLKVYVRYDATIDNTGGGGVTNGGPNDATVDRRRQPWCPLTPPLQAVRSRRRSSARSRLIAPSWRSPVASSGAPVTA